MEVTPCEISQDPTFPVGTAVRLVDLKSVHFNDHIGRIVVKENSKGRVGVQLHGVIWPCDAEEAQQRSPVRRLRLRQGDEETKTLALKPENLRRLRLESQQSCGKATDALDELDKPGEALGLGTVPTWALLRLLGESGWGLQDVVVAQVASQLRVPRVCGKDVKVTSASSLRGDYPLDVVLNENQSEWWISAPGSCPDGQGREYLEFSLGPGVRRLSCVGIRIPAMPSGPLSVRHFHVLARKCGYHPGTRHEEEPGWMLVSSKPLVTLDDDDLQEFALSPPVETDMVRIVFTENAASALCRGGMDCIGLFQIALA